MAKRVMVALSGGVDSSIALLRLREQGCDVAGATMSFGRYSAANAAAHGEEDGGGEDARRLCERLGIPHYLFDFSEHLHRHVIEDFKSEYLAGRTPNPCVRCNRFLKFGALLRIARDRGYAFLATGHYARIRQGPDGPLLCRARDSGKDQSYFLYAVPRRILESVIFPLGEMTKEQVRIEASNRELAAVDRSESQDICFLAGGEGYREFLGEEAHREGDMLDSEGQVIGRHRGVADYTVGQRRGLGIAAGKRLFVTAIDPRRNTVTVGTRENLASRGLSAGKVNLLVDRLPSRCTARIRYRHDPVACEATVGDDRLIVRFDTPQYAAAPGQSVVLYDNEVVLGGGVIEGYPSRPADVPSEDCQ